MLKKIVVVMIAAFGIVSQTAAQNITPNARIAALADCYVVDDIINIFYLPVLMNDFKNQVQGSAGPQEELAFFGPAVGVKSIGDKISVGALAYRRNYSGSMLYSSFYRDGRVFFRDTTELPGAFPVMPHLLFGMDFDVVKFGIDGFVEYTSYKSTRKDTATLENKQRISNAGLIANVGLSFGNFTLYPLVGFSWPRIGGKLSSSPTVSTEFSSEHGFYMKLGTDFAVTSGEKLCISGGVYYHLENYQFKLSAPNVTGLSDQTLAHSYEIYAGFTNTIGTNTLIALQYNFNVLRFVYKDTTTANDLYSKETGLINDIHFGCERPIEKIWIFDNITPRFGLAFIFGNLIYRDQNFAGTQKITTKIDLPYETSEVNLTAGLGVTRGIGTLDLFVDLGSWNGVVTGPQGIAATVTLDFGKVE